MSSDDKPDKRARGYSPTRLPIEEFLSDYKQLVAPPSERAQRGQPTPAMEALNQYLGQGLPSPFGLVTDGLRRLLSLARAALPATGMSKEVSAEIFRAVVVLNHAYLEDFLRTLALVLLPTAKEDVLNDVPLAGLGNSSRPEKFFLGKLAKHRGKSVDRVIKESVEEYLERSTFNSTRDIATFLKRLGLRLREDSNDMGQGRKVRRKRETFSQLGAMIQRRHRIVHRADISRGGKRLEPIDADQVLNWLESTLDFVRSVAETNFGYPAERIGRRRRRAAGRGASSPS